jgi:hypothetical protein
LRGWYSNSPLPAEKADLYYEVGFFLFVFPIVFASKGLYNFLGRFSICTFQGQAR